MRIIIKMLLYVKCKYRLKYNIKYDIIINREKMKKEVFQYEKSLLRFYDYLPVYFAFYGVFIFTS